MTHLEKFDREYRKSRPYKNARTIKNFYKRTGKEDKRKGPWELLIWPTTWRRLKEKKDGDKR